MGQSPFSVLCGRRDLEEKTLRNALATRACRSELRGRCVRAGSGSRLGGRSAVLPSPVILSAPGGSERCIPQARGRDRGTSPARCHPASPSASVAFALRLSLSRAVFHLAETHAAVSLDGAEVVCLLQVRHCQLGGQALSRSSAMGL